MIIAVDPSFMAFFNRENYEWVQVVPFHDDKDISGRVTLFYSLAEHDWEFSTIQYEQEKHSGKFEINQERDKKTILELYQNRFFHEFLTLRKETYDALESVMFMDTVEIESIETKESDKEVCTLHFRLKGVPLLWSAVFFKNYLTSLWSLHSLKIENNSDTFGDLKGFFLFEKQIISSLMNSFVETV